MTTGDHDADPTPVAPGQPEPPPLPQPGQSAPSAPSAADPGAAGSGPPASYGPPAGFGPPPGFGEPSAFGQPADYGQPGGYAPGVPPAAGYPLQPYAGPAGAPPDNYLVWAILTTVLCCLPLGIVSIVFAAQVNDKWRMGDVAGARESSRKARQFAIWSAVASVVAFALFLVFYIGIFAFAAVVGVSSSP